ncbi:ATP-binding protein [Micromonospora sp. NPDC005194]|uniref:ATP-binding protein n=1 Tax=Micromonospora sp. NPDC005194 TaxID=3156870 RepID=UPI0033AA679E
MPEDPAKPLQAPTDTGVGSLAGQIPVEITYRIIELFSAGLYSSPNKAIEELVSNSFDALASRVDVSLPANAATLGASIWVVDDGESMDFGGLRDLWQIARSPKANRREQRGGRLPIGKFGIGKLATYVLARKLTYVACRSGEVLCVEMDFGKINPDQSATSQSVTLDVVKLGDEALSDLMSSLRRNLGGDEVAARLLKSRAAGESWTAAVMDDAKPLASQIKHGRLLWLLSTALPNNPQFQVYMNGNRVASKVEEREPIAVWRIGEEPARPEGFTGAPLPSGLSATPVEGVAAGADADGPFVEIYGLPLPIRGQAAIYADELTENKAAEWGRSHGFFVMVRQRLINLDDPLFGMPALSHKYFNRFRIEIHADGLDPLLTSARESVQQGEEVKLIQQFLRSQFNLARRILDAHVQDREKSAQLADRIGRSARSLTRRPLFAAIEKALHGDVDHLVMVAVPSGLTPSAMADLLEKLRDSLESERGLIDSVEPVPLGAEYLISRYDPVMQRVEVNTLHPFYANFVDGTGSPEPFNVIAVTEILTEAYMLEEGLEPEAARSLIRRRDSFLRELVASSRRGPAAIAQNLIDRGDNEKELERALAEAFTSLGYAVSPIGGKGEPDGLAAALLGVRDGQRADYTISYDAKSTGSNAVSASHVGVQTLLRHARQYNTKLIVVVAPDFEGASDPNSSLLRDIRHFAEVQEGFITPVRVKDFAVLVAVAARRQIGFSKLREFIEECRTPDEAREWIRAQLEAPVEQAPLREILLSVEHVAREAEDTPTLATVSFYLKSSYGIRLKRDDLEEHLKGVARLVPGFLSLAGEHISLDSSPDKILQEISKQTTELDRTVLDKTYAGTLLDAPALPAPAAQSPPRPRAGGGDQGQRLSRRKPSGGGRRR